MSVTISDNGVGLPARDRRRLLEPYVTTREKGTGLGLAIVSKIVEEHHGRVSNSATRSRSRRARSRAPRRAITLPLASSAVAAPNHMREDAATETDGGE